MAAPAKINLKIYQGSSYSEVMKWESTEPVYKPITAVSNTAPLQITAPDHGVVKGWRVSVQGVKGIPADLLVCSGILDNDTLVINSINATALPAYTSGGVLEYYAPIALTGLRARMQIREKATSIEFIDELTTENGKIVISDIDKTITIQLDALTTAAYSFVTGVYSLEIVAGTTVTQLATGTVSLVKEITR